MVYIVVLLVLAAFGGGYYCGKRWGKRVSAGADTLKDTIGRL